MSPVGLRVDNFTGAGYQSLRGLPVSVPLHSRRSLMQTI